MPMDARTCLCLPPNYLHSINLPPSGCAEFDYAILHSALLFGEQRRNIVPEQEAPLF